jgi:hypothetical protein
MANKIPTKAEKDRQVYERFIELKEKPDMNITKATFKVMEEFGIAAASTVHAIRNRMEKKMQARSAV